MRLPYRFGSCSVNLVARAEETHRGEFDRAMQRVGAAPGEFENETVSASVGRGTRGETRRWQSDVAQGCPAGTDEEKRARRPAEGQGGQTPGPHPARVGRRM